MGIEIVAAKNFETLLLHLEDAEIDFVMNESEEDEYSVLTTFTLASTNGTLPCELGVIVLEELFYISADIDLEISKKEVPLLSVGLAIINNKLFLGQFLLDIEDLTISYYLTHYYGMNKITTDQYDYLIRNVVFFVDNYLDKIAKLLKHELSINDLITFVNDNT